MNSETPVRPAAEEEPPGVDAVARRAREGDGAAFAALYRRYAPMVHAVLLASGPQGEADDLLQEVFLSAWRGISRLRDETRVGPWLAAIARNGARTALGKRRRLEALPDTLEGGPPAEDGAEVLRIVRTLPEAYRETLAMRLVEGMSGPEIAAASGLTHGSVRVNLHRGMKLLRARLREEGWS
ncbi:MAG: sigma-70 family RNA polymerase sigma factor [Planctomycetes bacterium]|nr:sigma-70 family RNA polymerase sigma factor [Planctomycetota bacterium]